jgi:hypothetical protein
MDYDRISGHQELEASDGSSKSLQGNSGDQWQGSAAAIASIAACACHGCCDGEWSSEENAPASGLE